MIRDMKPTENITTWLSPDDTCKTNPIIYCDLSYPFKKTSNHRNNNGKPHRILTNSDAIIEKMYDNHDENDVKAKS